MKKEMRTPQTGNKVEDPIVHPEGYESLLSHFGKVEAYCNIF